ncbi:MAG: osmotically inducible protein OsmC [Desulfuromonas sp.]|nr:MAG: osmotically inducible protein OsmC [Desulfuromonas sp.]
MEITFPGGVAVNTEYNGFVTKTDQPEANGGTDSAPSPFDLFLSSLGACAGFFALRFCQQREIDTTGMKLTLDTNRNPESKRLEAINMKIHLPDGFPDKYRKSIIRATDQCAVKKVIVDPPEITVETV